MSSDFPVFVCGHFILLGTRLGQSGPRMFSNMLKCSQRYAACKVLAQSSEPVNFRFLIESSVETVFLQLLQFVFQLKYNDLSSAANAELFQKTENEEEHCRIYRNMKELVGNQWDSFVPETNVHWLYHITDQLLYYKKKTDFHTYDPTKREKLKKVYLELSSSKFKSCVDVILNSKLLKL